MLQKGFNATSIEDILKQASITKGGFFYHFDGKPGLAKVLIERYIEQDDQIFGDLFAEANELSEDPLHQLLIFLKLLAGKLGAMEDTHPGCLVAGFTYENQQFKPEIRELMRDGMLSWRHLIADQLHRINEKYAVPDLPGGEDGIESLGVQVVKDTRVPQLLEGVHHRLCDGVIKASWRRMG